MKIHLNNTTLFDTFKSEIMPKLFDKVKNKTKHIFLEETEEYKQKKKYNKKDYSKERSIKSKYYD